MKTFAEKKWEYLIESSDEDKYEWLTFRGNEGWELVQCEPNILNRMSPPFDYRIDYIFKRPLQENLNEK